MAGIHKVAKSAGIKDTQARSLFAAILDVLKNGERMHVMGFGSFFTVKRKARIIYTPQVPGGKAKIPARLAIRFKPANGAKAAVNGDPDA